MGLRVGLSRLTCLLPCRPFPPRSCGPQANSSRPPRLCSQALHGTGRAPVIILGGTLSRLEKAAPSVISFACELMAFPRGQGTQAHIAQGSCLRKRGLNGAVGSRAS